MSQNTYWTDWLRCIFGSLDFPSLKSLEWGCLHIGDLIRLHFVMPVTSKEVCPILICPEAIKRHSKGGKTSQATIFKNWTKRKELYCWLQTMACLCTIAFWPMALQCYDSWPRGLCFLHLRSGHWGVGMQQLATPKIQHLETSNFFPACKSADVKRKSQKEHLLIFSTTYQFPEAEGNHKSPNN